jgi:hypothetical protein
MNPSLCVGIAPKGGFLAMAALESGHPAVEASFPATGMGVAAIRVFLDGCRQPIRLAVAGARALDLALALSDGSGRDTVIVSSAVADQPLALASYAARRA